MVHNMQMYYWKEKDVHERLDVKMTSAYHSVLQTAERFNTHMRNAAYIVAVRRVTEAMKLRGWL